MRFFMLLALLAFVGCEGPMGPAGPQGTQGPAGPAGPQGPAGEDGLRQYVITGNVDAAGFAAQYIPASIYSQVDEPPVLSCYVSSEPEGPYFAVATTGGTDGFQCGFGEDSGGGFAFVSVPGNSGWHYIVVFTY